MRLSNLLRALSLLADPSLGGPTSAEKLDATFAYGFVYSDGAFTTGPETIPLVCAFSVYDRGTIVAKVGVVPASRKTEIPDVWDLVPEFSSFRRYPSPEVKNKKMLAWARRRRGEEGRVVCLREEVLALHDWWVGGVEPF